MPGVTYRPNLRPLPWMSSASTWIPSVEPLGGNLAGSVTHRPKPSTSGPWLPGHRYQKSSRLTYWYPTSARPLLLMASACALMLSAVGVRRMKLQLLHPSGGVRARPLSSAWAAGAPDVTATATRGVATKAAVRARINVLMSSSPRCRCPCGRASAARLADRRREHVQGRHAGLRRGTADVGQHDGRHGLARLQRHGGVEHVDRVVVAPGWSVAVRRGDRDVGTGASAEPVRRCDGERLAAAAGADRVVALPGGHIGPGEGESAEGDRRPRGHSDTGERLG